MPGRYMLVGSDEVFLIPPESTDFYDVFHVCPGAASASFFCLPPLLTLVNGVESRLGRSSVAHVVSWVFSKLVTCSLQAINDRGEATVARAVAWLNKRFI